MTNEYNPDATDIIIRPSSLPAYSDCKRRTIARYYPDLVGSMGFDVVELPNSIGAAVGTAVHAGAAASLLSVLDKGALCSMSEALDRAMDGLTKETAKGIVWDDATQNRGDADAQIKDMLIAFRSHAIPKLKLIAVEKRLETFLGPSKHGNFVVSGQADMVALEPDSIIDLKTGSQQRIHMPQTGAYSLIVRSHGRKVEKVKELFIKRVRKGTTPPPVEIVYPVERAETVARARILELQTDLLSFFDSGDPQAFSANPMSMMCTPKFCPAFGTTFCQEHKGS